MKYKIITRECPCCDKLTTILIPETAYEQWESGKPIQDAWPKGSATERETLISGLCGVCQEEKPDDIRFSNDDYLEFYVDGRRFWCDACVSYGLTSKNRVINTAERWKNGEQFGELSDKYVIWGDRKREEYHEVPECALVEWFWGVDEDLEPGAAVPKHIIDACKQWLKDN